MSQALMSQNLEELNRDRTQLSVPVQALEQTLPLARRLLRGRGNSRKDFPSGQIALKLVELVFQFRKEGETLQTLLHEFAAMNSAESRADHSR